MVKNRFEKPVFEVRKNLKTKVLYINLGEKWQNIFFECVLATKEIFFSTYNQNMREKSVSQFGQKSIWEKVRFEVYVGFHQLQIISCAFSRNKRYFYPLLAIATQGKIL